MLAKAARVHRSEEFSAIAKVARPVHAPHLMLRRSETTGPARIGFIVSNRVSAKATERNLLKRRLRAIVADRYQELPAGTALVITAKPGAAGLSYGELADETAELLKTGGLA